MLWVPLPFTVLQQSHPSLSPTPPTKTLATGTSSSWIHTHTPPQERHHFCSFLGVTCTKRQQLSTRRLGKAEAHPRAPCGKPPVPHSPSLGGAGKLPLALQFPAVPAGACAELAGCLYRGKGRRKAILNVKQAEKTLVPASFPRPALAVKAKRSFDSALRFTLKL